MPGEIVTSTSAKAVKSTEGSVNTGDQRPQLSVIVPLYNEQDNVGLLHGAIVSAVQPLAKARSNNHAPAALTVAEILGGAITGTGCPWATRVLIVPMTIVTPRHATNK